MTNMMQKLQVRNRVEAAHDVPQAVVAGGPFACELATRVKAEALPSARAEPLMP